MFHDTNHTADKATDNIVCPRFTDIATVNISHILSDLISGEVNRSHVY